MKKQIITGILVFLAMILVVLATPVFNSISDQTVNEAQTATVNVVLSSTNGATTFTLTQTTAWASIAKVDDTHATVTLSPGYDVVTSGASQAFDFTVTATDVDGSTTESFTVTVNNVNRNPTITGETVTIGYYDNTKQHTITASDPDSDTLSFSVTAAGDANIAQCTVDPSTGVLTATRKTDSAGSTICTVQVTDGKGGSATANFPVNVREILKLKIDKIKISGDVDSETYDEDDIDSTMEIRDVIPGGEVEVQITLENLYTDDEDIQIENIEVEGTIFNVDTGDDDDDIDSDTEEVDDIDPEEDADVTLLFEIPLVVEDGTYDMEIYIEAEDENGKDLDMTLDFNLEIKKEKYQVAIKDVSASPTIVKAGDSFSIDVEIVNIGTKDEDKARITVECREMDSFFISEPGIDLESDIDDDENAYETTLTIDVPEDTEPGDYLFEIEAYHDQDELDDGKTVIITVEEPSQAAQQEEEEEEIEVQQMTEDETQMITQTDDADITQTTEGESFTESTLFIILLIVGIVVVIILIILLLLLAFRR